ncbi:hypothetical protein [Haliangium ochraceum]|uniref:Exo-alpha-sialidase n=1 Tax=Haliangium ochraceum (strain DSM 14365 / JCM 11303 / SMP-2) TaxID=502025 RepID=D0LFZ6_HALO1|nr:hypothetical protein [Haliangium ochraceum]ACY14598.1 hypothetical protein Hoch_2053 [Haliangium ochraceum DSM 14365]
MDRIQHRPPLAPPGYRAAAPRGRGRGPHTRGLALASLALASLALGGLLLACGGEGDSAPDAGSADASISDARPSDAGDADGGGNALCTSGALTSTTWRDYGSLATHAASMLVFDDQLWVGTDDGLWSHPLTDDDGGDGDLWQQRALAGRRVSALRVLDAEAGTLLAGLASAEAAAQTEPAFALSSDRGQSFALYGAELGYDDAGTRRYDAVNDLAVHRSGAIYAAMSGVSIARSSDGGQSWSYVFGQPAQICYPCRLHIAAGAPDALYQGCECPLDMASIDRFALPESADGGFPDQGERLLDYRDIGNRRINSFASTDAYPGRVYAGVEGALLWLEGADEWDYLYRSMGAEKLYTYVEAIWIDPCDPAHIVFGGGEQSENQMLSLFESYDEGVSWEMLMPPGLSFDQAVVERGLSAGASGEHAILAVWTNSDGAKSVRILAKRHSP